MQLKLPKFFDGYQPKVPFCIDTPHFIIKTADTPEELIGAFHLRHNVFYKERKGVSLPSQLSIDEFDVYGDQLVIIHKEKKQVMGAYRFIPPQNKKYFCNWKFFHIQNFIEHTSNNIVEMEWACTHQQLRGKMAIRYLWVGMARYFKLSLAHYICGQVNILNISLEESANIYKTFLKHKKATSNPLVFPTKAYTIPYFNKILSKASDNDQLLTKLSRLFLWYLKMGGQVHGPPMFDPEFNSYGFFLSLDFKNIKQLNLVNRYQDALDLKNQLKS